MRTLTEIKKDIEQQMKMSGLSDGLYGDYASEVAHEYAKSLKDRIAELEIAGSKEKSGGDLTGKAPSNSLPDWDECSLRMSNEYYLNSHGLDPEPDTLLPNEVHRFIYEYDCVSHYKSDWFLHRLENLIEFVKAEAIDEYKQGEAQ